MDFLWIIVQIISGIFGIICTLALSKWRLSKTAVFVSTAVFVAVLSVANFIAVRDLSFLLDDYPVMDFVYRMSNIILAAIFILLLSERNAAQVAFTILTVWVCIMFVDTFALSLRASLKNYALELLLEILLYSGMTFLVVKLRKPFLRITGYIGNRLWPLCTTPALLAICFLLQISIPTPLVRNPGNIPVALMLCAISAAVYGFGFLMFRILLAQSELEHNIKVMELNSIALEHQNHIASQKDKKAALFRHDLRHTGQMILACLNVGDIDGARSLINDINQSMNISDSMGTVREITGHRLLDTTLSYYADSVKDYGIDISISMSSIDGIFADKSELAVVLSNALENAVNACKDLPDKKPRVIRVDGQKHGKQYFLEIANTFGGDVSFDPDTGLPLSDKHGHGLGCQSIAYFAQKNGAVLEYSVKDNWFHLRLLL